MDDFSIPEEPRRSPFAVLLSFFIVVVLIALFSSYFFLSYVAPSDVVRFISSGASPHSTTNFSLSASQEVQFAPNLRFSQPTLTYRILPDCPIQKRASMENAFATMEDLTILTFTPVSRDEDITVLCEHRERRDIDGFYVAGEGGPTSYTPLGTFNIITQGEIVLIRNERCEEPVIAIHELLHVLGFDHSPNPQNIMYNFSSCDQEIGDDTLDLINDLYSIPSLPDLVLHNVSATQEGAYVHVNASVFNAGLNRASGATLRVTSDKGEVKTIALDPIEVGYTRIVTLQNIRAPRGITRLTVSVSLSIPELDDSNNEVTLE